MIHEKAIFIKLNQLKVSDQQLFDAALSDFKPSECSCPICHAVGRIVPLQSSYTRTMISVSNGKRVDCEISIPRYQCESCGHTHGLLPDCLILYSSFTPRFILTILCAYLNRSCSVADFCKHWDIAISTLYDWIHRFIDHHNAWCRILDRILWITKQAIDRISSITALPSDFFSRFHRSFLQRCKTTPSGCPPPPDRRYRRPSTVYRNVHS